MGKFEITLLVIFVIGSVSACNKKTHHDCEEVHRNCLVDQTLLLNFKNLGGKATTEEYKCGNDEQAVAFDLTGRVPFCLTLMAPKSKKECNGCRLHNVTLLDCGKVIEVHIKRSKLCLLDGLVTLYLECGEIELAKKKTTANVLTQILYTVIKLLTSDCDCDGFECKKTNKKPKKGGPKSDSDSDSNEAPAPGPAPGPAPVPAPCPGPVPAPPCKKDGKDGGLLSGVLGLLGQ